MGGASRKESFEALYLPRGGDVAFASGEEVNLGQGLFSVTFLPISRSFVFKQPSCASD